MEQSNFILPKREELIIIESENHRDRFCGIIDRSKIGNVVIDNRRIKIDGVKIDGAV